MQVLPDRAADCAGYADVVLQPAQSPRNRRHDQVGKDLHSGAGAHAVVVEELDAADFAAYYETAVAAVPYQDVRARAEQEEWKLQRPSGKHGIRELVRCARPVHVV